MEERVARVRLEHQIAACLDNPVTGVILDCADGHALILNENKQVLAANASLLEMIGEGDDSCLRGLCLGDILHCVHSLEGPAGCGSSTACNTCGAMQALLSAQKKDGSSCGEFLAASRKEGRWESREFSIRATVVQMYTFKFIVMVFRDISGEKRRESLEHVFLHDLVNYLHGLRGWAEMINFPKADPKEIMQRIQNLTDRLTLSVKSQHLLMEAEHGHLRPMLEPVDLPSLFHELNNILHQHSCLTGRTLTLPKGPANLHSDRSILLKILLDMILNALEATPPGGEVAMETIQDGGCLCFRVHNPGFIPKAVGCRIFHRSFTTKSGLGRGFGTYSIKLLGENTLKGEVDFYSTETEGTTFEFRHPMKNF